ncbi:MAG: hypothetical protein KDE25_00035 [Novosphingobium sp.]|nr:hypothetical protein [Novosphingobium sp.]
MTKLTGKLTRALVGTVAAGAMAATTASPALASDRDNNDGIKAGEVIAGALIIGGIAAVAASAGKKDRYDYGYGRDYRYDRSRYGNYGRYGRNGSRGVVDQCVRAAENHATRYTRGRADVTQVTRVERKRNGYNVRGRIAVQDRGYRWNRSGYDTGRFTCKVRYGRIADLDYSGIRGLR